MKLNPTVSVIVPHYNDLAGLDACLTALERQTYPSGRFEIVVSDNASPEGQAAVATTIRGRARLVVTAERGAGPARNAGVAASQAPILAFTDSDCIPEPAWLEQGVAALERTDFAGGRMVVLVDNIHRVSAAEAFERVFAFDNAAYVTRKGFTVTANLFCPRAVFEAVGGFRNGVSEDIDWSRRARASGYRLGYAPEAIVGHPARRTWEDLKKKWRRMNVEQFGLALAQPAGRWGWLARSCLLPVSALAHSPKVLASGELATWSQRAAALAMLFRLRFWRFADSIRLLAQATGP